jgi:hypothetical protein
MVLMSWSFVNGLHVSTAIDVFIATYLLISVQVFMWSIYLHILLISSQLKKHFPKSKLSFIDTTHSVATAIADVF